MVEKSTHVKVAVEPERKDRWESAVSDNPNVGTLSGLIRLAVEREIGNKPQGNGVGDEVNEALSELIEENRQLSNQLQGMEARLGSIEQAVQEDPEVAKLANEIFAVLPTKEQFHDEALPARIPEDQGGPVANSGRVADMAALLGVSELQVRRGLDKLQSDTARVREAEGNDGVRYFKEV